MVVSLINVATNKNIEDLYQSVLQKGIKLCNCMSEVLYLDDLPIVGVQVVCKCGSLVLDCWKVGTGLISVHKR